MQTVQNLEPRTTNAAESFNGRVNKACPPNCAFWRIVDVLRLFAGVVEKDIAQVMSGMLPERKSAANGKLALEKMKSIKATTTFDLSVEDMLEALAAHSETDWCGRETKKDFADSDAAMAGEVDQVD